MFQGADVQALRGCADQLRAGRERVGSLLDALDGAVAQMPWEGPDAADFRAGFAEVRARAAATGEDLGRRGDELIGHADEQDAASAAGGEGSGPGADPQNQALGGLFGPGEGEAWIWPWEDGGRWAWQDRTDIRDDIPIDDPDEFGIDAMNQRGIPNCITVSFLGALSEEDPQYFMDRIDQVGPGVYEVTLYDDAGRPVTYTIEDDVLPDGARGPDGYQNWMTLYEAALIEHGTLNADGMYDGVGSAADVVQAVTGVENTHLPVSFDEDGNVEQTWPWDQGGPIDPELAGRLVDNGYTVVYGTDTGTGDLPVVDNHAYVVVGTDQDGNVIVENPWGPSDGYGGENGTERMLLPPEVYSEAFSGGYVAPPRDRWAEEH